MSKKIFANMSNEELCAIIFNLKSQLVEARFKMSSGELSKVNLFSQIRKSIARVFTELTSRGYDAIISKNDVILYDLKDSKKKPLVVKANKIKEIIASRQAQQTKKKTTKTTKAASNQTNPNLTKNKNAKVVAEPTKEVK